jgi:hypothetical protein
VTFLPWVRLRIIVIQLLTFCYLSHRMLIEEKALRHWIDNYYGYGSWEARIWLVGYEEGDGDLPEDVAEKLGYFYKVHPPGTHAALCDIRDLYRRVTFRSHGRKAGMFTNRYDYRFGRNAILNGLWKNLIAFVHGYNDRELPDSLEYQKSAFASPAEKSETLIRLYPLPSPHNHAWYYSWLDLPQLDFLKGRASYKAHVYHNRMDTIRSNIRTNKPDLVLMYGMNNINLLKRSIQEFFPHTSFKMIKAIKRQIPQHHRADLADTTILITTQIPALRHNRIETGFDWQEFGKRV